MDHHIRRCQQRISPSEIATYGSRVSQKSGNLGLNFGNCEGNKRISSKAYKSPWSPRALSADPTWTFPLPASAYGECPLGFCACSAVKRTTALYTQYLLFPLSPEDTYFPISLMQMNPSHRERQLPVKFRSQVLNWSLILCLWSGCAKRKRSNMFSLVSFTPLSDLGT